MFVLPTFNSVFVTVKYGIRNEIVYTCSFILVSFKFIGNGKVWGGGGEEGVVLGEGSGCHRFIEVRTGDDFGRIFIPDVHD